ncbi:hypothetical protein ACFL0H_05765 [Thermodesulfobacteriota bacterium]
MYEWEGEEGYIDLRFMLRGYCTAYENPENDFFYDHHSESDLAGVARFLLQARAGKYLGFEVNAYQTYIPKALVTHQASLGTILDVERSAAMEWGFSNEKYVHLAIDRLNVRWSKDRIDLILGRQPINLATTFFFSPNDFFAPFAAQTFYRVYKPGVDAIRAEVRLGDLSQLTLISALGYSRAPGGDTGWSDEPESDRASYIFRVSTVYNDFEWALIGGPVRKVDVIGGSLQGELFKWLGVRAEGHVADPDDSRLDSYTELSVGLEHRWTNSLDVRLEHFHHGIGLDSVSDYSAISTAANSGSSYLGRNYLAIGAGYEFTPLLSAEMSVISNLKDNSCLWSLNTVYSLSNEAELSLNLGVPVGKEPEGAEIKSEFGLYPYSINAEVRYYF